MRRVGALVKWNGEVGLFIDNAGHKHQLLQISQQKSMGTSLLGSYWMSGELNLSGEQKECLYSYANSCKLDEYPCFYFDKRRANLKVSPSFPGPK